MRFINWNLFFVYKCKECRCKSTFSCMYNIDCTYIYMSRSKLWFPHVGEATTTSLGPGAYQRISHGIFPIKQGTYCVRLLELFLWKIFLPEKSIMVHFQLWWNYQGQWSSLQYVCPQKWLRTTCTPKYPRLSRQAHSKKSSQLATLQRGGNQGGPRNFRALFLIYSRIFSTPVCNAGKAAI